ncbi:MAG: type III restriction endonuclease subunit R [Candidatus Liberibacter ctenarytainae]|uniref:Type III restriction endonuclease subunit R n=1 Tax=Candidatus Liberibacter ctenarytainae TaxID=2020335 RepID=A0A937ARR9_9HYPH|nr:type III restriction endonuclease subunit R [Candidatus Liberibacter ctenarytainae]
MDKNVNSIADRLSLRTPQRNSLEILARVVEIMPLDKKCDITQAMEIIKSEFPTVDDFEREFPSLCFELATGVGKTRLMGAFITYLHLEKGIRHFFVLAPNLTIYNKLIADFMPGTKKYVFQGIAEFSLNPPEIITGDNYESGRGVRGTDMFSRPDNIHINIFNISKINGKVKDDKSVRIKRISEYIGESYFDYLSKLDDLVLLMDESHRYRANAGLTAINELKPIIGLELTATPQMEDGRKVTPFKNVIYSYRLSEAMKDGYIKGPAVTTRENFNAKNYTEEQLERLKLEDGVSLHEIVKTELKVYADNNGKPYVKPFVLVVAQDTTHAGKLMELIKSDEFFEGRYRDRVITVHSAQSGQEKDKTVERLLSVEDPKEPTEIVIHVNMLKEGWDVTNLYTIVPLRAANSRTLVEQSIGRGLRLPYGKRTGVSAIDRLTIIAHDKFHEIISEADNPNSIIRTGITIGKDISLAPKKAIEIHSNLDSLLGGHAEENLPDDFLERPAGAPAPLMQLFNDERENEVAQATMKAIKAFESPTLCKLRDGKVQQDLIDLVQERLTPAQADLDGIVEKTDIPKIVKEVIEACIENTIDIPRIILDPKGSQNYTFEPFKLDTHDIGRLNPVDQKILIQYLLTSKREQVQSDTPPVVKERLEDYIIAELIHFDDISYDGHTDILNDLSAQMVAYLRSYLNQPSDISNVLQYHDHRQKIANVIHKQMQQHFQPGTTEFKVTVNRGFKQPKTFSVSCDASEKVHYFRYTVEQKRLIRGMLFQGFCKCIYPIQQFHSDTERMFSVILEDDASVHKWFKPVPDDFKIFYRSEHTYKPDFVVETEREKLICETKMEKDMESPDVLKKERAAIKWCEAATTHALDNGGKPWRYVLIPHSAVKPSATLVGLISKFGS